jgi:hypothetical protein
MYGDFSGYCCSEDIVLITISVMTKVVLHGLFIVFPVSAIILV